jgi:hypothetical protein
VLAYFWARSQRGKSFVGDSRRSAMGMLIGRLRTTHADAISKPKSRASLAAYVFAGLVALTFLNLFTFLVATLYIGGDAISGKAEGGRFYVSSHGRLTEVSEGWFNFSQWQARSVWVSMVAVFLIALLARYAKRRRQRPKIGREA